MLTLHRLRVFVTAAKHLHVSDAAAALHIVQSAASHEISRLEEDIGVKLIMPTGRGIRLTREGLEIYKSLPALLDGIETLLTKHKAAKANEVAGTLTIGGSHGPSFRAIPTLITTFRQAFSGVQVYHRAGTSSEMQQALVDGKVELALLSNPARRPGLAIERYGEERLVFVAAPGHKTSKEPTLTAAQLAEQELLIGDGKDGDSATLTILRRRLPARLALKIGARFDNPGALKSSVKTGGGIGILYHDMVADELGNGSLKEITVTGVNLAGQSHLVYLKANPLSAVAAKFVAHMRMAK